MSDASRWHGGSGGSPFDLWFSTATTYVARIVVTWAHVVSSIELFDQTGASMGVAGTHASNRGEFKLREGEYITGISGAVGTLVDNIRFLTNFGSSSTFGGTGGASFLENNGSTGRPLGGLAGRAGSLIDAIGVWYRAPFIPAVLYKIQNRGSYKQQLNVLDPGGSWCYLEGHTNENKSEGFLFRFYKKGNLTQILSAHRNKQNVLTRQEASSWRYFGVTSSSERESDYARFRFVPQKEIPLYYSIRSPATGDRELYFKDRNQAYTWVWGSTLDWERDDVEGFLFKFVPQQFNLMILIDEPFYHSETELQKVGVAKPPITTALIGPHISTATGKFTPPSKEIKKTVGMEYQYQVTKSKSLTASLEIRAGVEVKGLSLEKSWGLATNVTNQVVEGKTVQMSTESVVYYRPATVDVPTGYDCKYQLLQYMTQYQLKDKSRVLYGGQAVVPPQNDSVEQHSGKRDTVVGAAVFNFVDHSGLNVTGLQYCDNTSVWGEVTENTVVSSFTTKDEWFLSPHGKDKWEPWNPNVTSAAAPRSKL